MQILSMLSMDKKLGYLHDLPDMNSWCFVLDNKRPILWRYITNTQPESGLRETKEKASPGTYKT